MSAAPRLESLDAAKPRVNALQDEREHEQDDGRHEGDLGEARRESCDASEAEEGRHEGDDGEDDKDREEAAGHESGV